MNDEEILPIPHDNIAIERVISGDEVKTFQRSATVLFLDDECPGERYEGADVGYDNPVPVVSDDGKVIGSCELHLEGRRVEGEFFLDYHIPERLEIEEGVVKLYPDIESLEALDTSHPPWRVAFCNIQKVVLTSAEPRDKRLLSL